MLILALLSVVWAGLSGCGDKQAHNRAQRPPVPVDVAEVIQRDTPLYVDSIGNVVAYNTVDVRSRVTGEVIKRFFKEGDRLKKGQELFVIDPAPFMAKVKEAEAKLNQSQVQFEQSITDYHRFEGLFSEKAISQEQLENKRVDMNSKRYQVELNKAELESARLNLGYCFINSPLDGESGEIYVDNHNIVNANQDRLVTIKQTQPIKVRFSVPGKFLEQIRHHSQQGEVEVAAIPLGTEEPEKGRLTMMDNVINIRTGMIMLEGTFPNSNAKLWPGEFVRVRLRLSVTRNAVLVPTRAVMDGPEGQYVWVMNSDQKVSVRPVKIDRRNGATDVVSEGLKPGEIVITAGRLMLYPGAQVITRQQIEEIRKGRPASADGARDTKQRNEAPKS
ncbi:MAG: efflux RND transporter periplasmic adaptor subunit [Desulfomonile sp.]|nr:efflux RND transporter periplasmic adaptor subunit [Desulfomonile sp.]